MMKISLLLAALAVAAACQSVDSVPPESWISDGDSDGDGLKDEFEVRHGLNPQKAESFADGIPDEDRVASNGQTMWDLQIAESATPVAGAGSGGACGALGLEAIALVALLGVLRRRN